MRFMVIVKATKDSEAGKMPSGALVSAMAKFNEVADTLCVGAGENVCFSPCRSARSSMAGRPYVRYGS
jgi:hypothetical protein